MFRLQSSIKANWNVRNIITATIWAKTEKRGLGLLQRLHVWTKHRGKPEHLPALKDRATTHTKKYSYLKTRNMRVSVQIYISGDTEAYIT